MTTSPEFDATNFHFDFEAIEQELAKEHEHQAIREEVCARMDAWGIRRLIGSESDSRSEQTKDFIESVRERETERFRTVAGGEERFIRGEHHDWVTLACYESLYHQVELQAVAIEYAEKLINASRQPEGVWSNDEIDSTKWLAQGFLVVSCDFEDEEDRKLYEFFQEVAPGVSIETAGLVAKAIVDQAAAAVVARQMVKDEIMAATKRLAGLGEDDYSDDAAGTMMTLRAIMHRAPRAVPHERGYTIREMGVQLGLEKGLLDKLITYYVETLPVQYPHF